MAINILEKQKKQKYLIFVFLGLIIIIFIVAWFFWGPGKTFPKGSIIPTTPTLSKVKIDFEVLRDPILQKLQPFEEIQPFEDEIGRDNLFFPY